jgi:hypothetical protein
MCLLTDEPEQANLIEDFFSHYLIARQLNDDAHDWLEDLQHGYINSVSAPMLQFFTPKDISSLQEYFWKKHIDIVCGDIMNEITKAQVALKKIIVLHKVTFLEQLLEPLEHSAAQAIADRDKTRHFLERVAWGRI